MPQEILIKLKIRIFLVYTIFIFLTIRLISQEEAKKVERALFTDTSLVVGVVIGNFSGICDEISAYCSCYSKILSENTAVVVSGVKNCQNSNNESIDFFEIIYKNNIYYLRKEFLFTSKNIDHFSEISKLPENLKTSFFNNAKNTAAAVHFKTLNDGINFIKSCDKSGLAIFNWYIYDESEYTEGTSIKIEYYNPTKKPIKYITATIVGFNSVGDKVFHSIKQSYNIQLKSVGPLEPEASGTYKFEYAWLTDMVEKAKILSISVQYMDGTSKTITNADSITLDKKLYEYLIND